MDRRQDDGRLVDGTLHVAEVDERDEPASRSGRRRRWLVAGAIAAAVGIVAATVAMAVGGSDDGQRVVVGRATLAVRAALDATMESGGYEIRFETESSGTAVGPQTVDGHGTINVRPYGLATVANVSGLGAILVRTDGVSIWEHGGGNYGLTPDGTEGPGQPLSGFAGLVESTIGRGPGAVSMLNLASPTGYLALASPSVTSATAAGTGTVDGVPVTYYAARVDLRRLADLPGLGAEQAHTIASAAATLDDAGYDGTDTRIAIDGTGYVVETVATTVFSDGARFRTHTVLSHFGCVGRVVMPDDVDATAPAPSTGCSAATSTTTAVTAPAAPSSTTVSSTSTTTTTTTVVPETLTSTSSSLPGATPTTSVGNG